MAWSRPERLIAVGFLCIGLTTVATAAYAVRSWRLDRMVRSDFLVLEEACRLYRNAYQRWPVRRDILSDVRYGDSTEFPNLLVMNTLRGTDGPGNPGGALNPDRKVFLELRPASTRLSGSNPDGSFVDPWGTAYQMIFDMNGDNTCDLPDARYGSAVNTQVALWSYGPDRKADTPDDLTSWEQ